MDKEIEKIAKHLQKNIDQAFTTQHKQTTQLLEIIKLHDQELNTLNENQTLLNKIIDNQNQKIDILIKKIGEKQKWQKNKQK